MKSALIVLLLIVPVAGCVAKGPTKNGQQNSGPAFDTSTSSASAPAPNTGPQLVVPVTGGAPVIGIPVGGNLYVPVTGGPPVVGLPTGP